MKPIVDTYEKIVIDQGRIYGNLTRPLYSGLSICNILPTVIKSLGVHPLNIDSPFCELSLKNFQKNLRRKMEAVGLAPSSNIRNVVIFILDSISYGYFKYLCGRASWLRGIFELDTSVLFPITSTFPSTSSTALASFVTGRPPLHHGILGVTFYLPEVRGTYHLFRNTYTTSKGRTKVLTKNSFLYENLETLPDTCRKAKIETIYMQRKYDNKVPTILKYPLFRLVTKGTKTEFVRPPFPSGVLERITSLIKSNRQARKIIIAHMLDLDRLIHQYGPYSKVTDGFVLSLFENLKKGFLRFEPYVLDNGDTTMVICADHGQIRQKPKSGKEIFGFVNRVSYSPIGGAGRVHYFYINEDYREEIDDLLQKMLGREGYVISRSEALKDGLYGDCQNVSTSCSKRIGVTIALARGARFPSHSSESVAEHGSLTKEEMIVPFAAFKLDKELKRFLSN